MASVVINRPNFLQSEVGMRLVTVGVSAVSTKVAVTDEVDSEGFTHKVVRAGAIFTDDTAGVIGIVYQDVDVTGTTESEQKTAPVLVSGHFYNDTKGLPVVATTEQITKMASHGLFAEKRTTTVRPYGETTL